MPQIADQVTQTGRSWIDQDPNSWVPLLILACGWEVGVGIGPRDRKIFQSFFSIGLSRPWEKVTFCRRRFLMGCYLGPCQLNKNRLYLFNKMKKFIKELATRSILDIIKDTIDKFYSFFLIILNNNVSLSLVLMSR